MGKKKAKPLRRHKAFVYKTRYGWEGMVYRERKHWGYSKLVFESYLSTHQAALDAVLHALDCIAKGKPIVPAGTPW